MRRLRFLLFTGTGLAVPFYAFAPILAFGKRLDLATVLAALFVAAGALSSLGGERPAPSRTLFLGCALALPLLVLLPPQPERFDGAAFAVSLGHWALVILFFVFALSLDLTEAEKRRLASANLALGVAVAAFALYQAVGVPRGWPATGHWLAPFQREALRLSPSGPGSGYARPTSIFLEPAWMGGYLVGVLLLGAGLLRSETRGLSRRALVGAALGVVFLALAASVSWGAYADAAAAGLALLAGVRRSAGVLVLRRALYAVVAMAALLALLLLTPPGRTVGEALSHRWSSLRSTPLDGPGTSPQVLDSSWIRARNAAHTLELWKSHPWRGVGLGQFRRHAPSDVERTQEWVAQSAPWCGWLTIGAEMGPAGPALLLAAVLLVVSRWDRGRHAAFAWLVPALAAVCAVQQLHTGSYIDLWWWFPLALGGVLASGPLDGPGVPRPQM